MRHRSRFGNPAPLVLAFALLGGCFADVVEPTRDLRIELESPNGPEGAAVIEVVGPGLGDVTAPDGYVFTRVSGDTTRVVILLEDPGPIAFTIHMTGLSFPGIAVLEVSDDRDDARSLSGYRARIAATKVPLR